MLIDRLKYTFKKALQNFTLAKLISALLTITILATVKYAISGNLYIDYCNFWTNIGVGLLSFTVNTGFIGLLSEYLGINGLNINLKEIIFGFETMQIGDTSSPKVTDKLKVKVYLAMESDEESNSNQKLDKGKGPETTVPSSSTGVSDFASIFPPRFNPGPGFNVPGGKVPIRDGICQHINYNSHILDQFRTMDLETAVQQRGNYWNVMRVMDEKIAFATNVLQRVPAIPTTEYEFNLKSTILRDLKEFNAVKINAEGRATLINSRIEFIVSKIERN